MSHVDDGTLHAYLDGELPPGDARGVDAHLAQCSHCRNRLEEERALIARADKLLGRAAPPDRPLPAFRPGDVNPPARLWWRVRLPLAWAATVALALGAGLYLGSGTWRLGPSAEQRTGDLASVKTAPPAASETGAAPQRRAPTAARPLRSMPAPAALGVVAEEETAAAPRGRDNAAVVSPARDRAIAPAAAPAPSPPELVDARSYAVTGPPLSLDSARALLGADPRVVPDLPIRGIYRARMIGYSAVVIVEQSLDSSTAVTVITGRPSQLMLGEVVVAGAAQPDSVALTERARLGRAGAPTDSLPAAARRAKAVPAPARPGVADRLDAGLYLEVRAPVSADSLVALRNRLQPLRP